MTDPKLRLATSLANNPLIAILRGLKPDEALWVGETLMGAGITAFEVPLNSPSPYDSIEILRKRFGDSAIIGAGTVTTTDAVANVQSAGGELIVSPNANIDVISESVRRNMISCPGCLTPTEVFAALGAGAHGVKIFPASVIGPAGIKAMGATLPDDTLVIAVGGVSDKNMGEFAAVGVVGFGMGSSLFTPGISPDEFKQRVEQTVAAARQLKDA